MKLEAEIRTLNNGWVELKIWAKESEFTTSRFSRDEEGEYILRPFNKEKIVFEEDSEKTEFYYKYFETKEEAEKELERIIKEFQEQERLLTQKQFREVYEIVVTPEEVKWNRKE